MEHGDLMHDAHFWVAVSFVVFVLLVIWKARGVIRETVTARIERIRTEIDTAESLKEDAKATLAEFKRKQRDALAQAEAIVENAKEETKIIRKEARKRLDESLKRREQQAMDKIAQAEANALAEVRGKAVDMAITAASSILTEQMSGKGGDATIDASIKALPGKLH